MVHQVVFHPPTLDREREKDIRAMVFALLQAVASLSLLLRLRLPLPLRILPFICSRATVRVLGRETKIA